MRATDLQQHNIQKTKTILLQCKNPLFARQKPYFYTAKTILLFCEYVTYTEWTRCEHSAKYQRSTTKFPTNTHENTQRTPRKISTNTPKTPNLHSARRRGRFIVPVFFLCQIRIFPLLNTCIRFIANGCPHLKIRIFKSPHTHFCSPFCGCLRICGHDKSAPTAANGLPTSGERIAIMQRTPTKTPNEQFATHNIQKTKTILLFSLKCNAITP